VAEHPFQVKAGARLVAAVVQGNAEEAVADKPVLEVIGGSAELFRQGLRRAMISPVVLVAPQRPERPQFRVLVAQAFALASTEPVLSATPVACSRADPNTRCKCIRTAGSRLACRPRLSSARFTRPPHSIISERCSHTGTNAAVSVTPIVASPFGENAQSSAARTLSSSRPQAARFSSDGCKPVSRGIKSRKNRAWRIAAALASPLAVSFSSAYALVVSSSRHRPEDSGPSGATSDFSARLDTPMTLSRVGAAPATAVAASRLKPPAKMASWRSRRRSGSDSSS
jgi:hypothetical protein